MKKLLFMLFIACWAVSNCHAQAKIKDTTYNNYFLRNGTFSGAQKYIIADSAGPWLIWVKDSDTLELIKPTKVHFIKIGKEIIKVK